MIAKLAARLLLVVALIGGAPAHASEGRITLDVRDADIVDVLRLVSAESGVNVVTDDSIKHDRITLHLRDIRVWDALSAIAHAYDLQVRRDGAVYIVGASAAMNRKFPDGGGDLASQTVVVRLRSAHPDDIAKPLGDALPPGTVIVADKRTSSLVITGDRPTIDRARRLLRALDAPGYGVGSYLAVALPLRYARSTDAVKQLHGVLPESAYVADDRQNAIVVNGSAETIAMARQLLAAIDVPAPQVMFEVKVADITLENENSNVGVLFGGIGPNTIGVTNWTFANRTIPIQATLNALVSQNHAQILATPRIATLNNKEASLLVGTSYPISTQTTTNGQTSVSVTFVDYGVKLRLTPTIGADGSITAELHPEFSALEGVSEAGYPIIANRKVDATLRVAKDETIVLGGLLSDTTSETVTKFPFLGDIPVFGEVFRNRQRQHQKDDIVFLITPHIL